MKDTDLQKLINQAWNAKRNGKYSEALKAYNQAFNVLIKEASEHARKFDDASKDESKTRKILPKFFGRTKEYLRQDDIACKISNNMGTIFAELEDYESAERMFKQAIELTPDGMDYQDPKIGLKELEK